MRAPDAMRSANFAGGMGFALVTAVGWGMNWPVPKYLLTELPLLSTYRWSLNPDGIAALPQGAPVHVVEYTL